MTDIAERVKRLRMMKGLTVRSLAMRAGVSASYIYAIESGKRGSSIQKLSRIAAALGVSLSQLWKDESL